MTDEKQEAQFIGDLRSLANEVFVMDIADLEDQETISEMLIAAADLLAQKGYMRPDTLDTLDTDEVLGEHTLVNLKQERDAAMFIAKTNSRTIKTLQNRIDSLQGQIETLKEERF